MSTMKNLMYTKLRKYLQFCPKSGKMVRINSNINGNAKLFIPILGLFSLVWILIRVITKPSRITYPCMKVAMPLASGFLAYLSGLVTSVFAFRFARIHLRKQHYWLTGLFAITGGLVLFFNVSSPGNDALAENQPVMQRANEPIGEAKGIFPGRVVWVHNPDATNENCVPNEVGHAWWEEENNNQLVIDRMLSRAVQEMSGVASDSAAWDAIFRYHNQQRGKGDVGYATGEKIFIKTNATSAWSQNIRTDLTIIEDSPYYGVAETSPHVIHSILRQLVYVVGVLESDIYIGDPMKHIYQHIWEKWHAEFPGVHYLDHNGWRGRERVHESNTAVIDYSDNGDIIGTSRWGDQTPIDKDHLYSIFEECEYLLNVPTMKGHVRSGITLFAKNHFGSQTRGDASHLHAGLIAADGVESDTLRSAYGQYRTQVDLMGHELLGKKTLIFLLDALWSTGRNELNPPVKWEMSPFNHDWTSSLFVSQDMVAIESVAYDFLRSEYTEPTDPPQMAGTDDYLHQAADPAFWPVDIVYDPEGDGTILSSLGTHEHWNNSIEKEYSRNLDPQNGSGIELVYLNTQSTGIAPESNLISTEFTLLENFPNPFNPTTYIRFRLSDAVSVRLDIFNIKGQHVNTLLNDHKFAGNYTILWDGTFSDGRHAPSGNYYYRLTIHKADGAYLSTTKQMSLLK